jgi:hypothetical protein
MPDRKVPLATGVTTLPAGVTKNRLADANSATLPVLSHTTALSAAIARFTQCLEVLAYSADALASVGAMLGPDGAAATGRPRSR